MALKVSVDCVLVNKNSSELDVLMKFFLTAPVIEINVRGVMRCRQMGRKCNDKNETMKYVYMYIS